jgi:hypothetical protein
MSSTTCPPSPSQFGK